jgi:hypothetical protein
MKESWRVSVWPKVAGLPYELVQNLRSRSYISCEFFTASDVLPVAMAVMIISLKVYPSEIFALVAHYLPGDTVLHSWEVLAKILASDETLGIVCDLGM